MRAMTETEVQVLQEDDLKAILGGAVLEASSAHKGRSGRNHLRIVASAAGLPDSRVDDVLALTGLTPAGKRKWA